MPAVRYVLYLRLVESPSVICSGGGSPRRAESVDVVHLGGGSCRLGRLLRWQGQPLLEQLLSSRWQQPPAVEGDIGPAPGFVPWC